MNLGKVFKSGTFFRRKSQQQWYSSMYEEGGHIFLVKALGNGDTQLLYIDDIIADDWEVEEK